MSAKVIMIIDDNPIDNFINKTFIESRDITHDILEFGIADKAIAYLKDENNAGHLPHLILLDINLPALSGYDFLEEFEKLPDSVRKKSAIMVLSSSDKEEDIVDMTKNPRVKNYFVKPLNEMALKEIRNFLNEL